MVDGDRQDGVLPQRKLEGRRVEDRRDVVEEALGANAGPPRALTAYIRPGMTGNISGFSAAGCGPSNILLLQLTQLLLAPAVVS